MFHVFSLEPISPYLTIYLSKKTDLYEYTLGHHRLIYVLDNLLYTHSQFLCKFSVCIRMCIITCELVFTL